jgi:hypothetical protein
VIEPEHGLERALSQTAADAEAALKAALAVVAQLKKVTKAAAVGSIRDLDKGLEQATQLAVAARDAISSARAGWRFDTQAHLESGAYKREVMALAQERGVHLKEQGDRIVSFPSLVRILPTDAAVEIDRRKRRELRPSHLIDALQVAQARPPRFRPEPFIEGLLRAYRLVAAEQKKEAGETVRLVDVYKVLTLLPGQTSAYSLQEFGRDIHLLDESRVDRTRDGLRMSLPAASGARTGGALPTVTREGEVKVYFGIAFRP